MIFNEIKNDVAFIIDDRFIILTEHQSTRSPNFPLRMLCYLGKEYEKTSFSKDIFSTRLKKIPTPELYVFYEGVEDAPVEWELKLSDAFKEKCDTISVEVVVKVINVNYEKGAELLARCKTMQEYSLFMHMIRVKYAEAGDIMSVLEVNLTIEEREEIRWQDGYEEGVEEATLKIAKKLKASGMDVEAIAENTGLNVEEIEGL